MVEKLRDGKKQKQREDKETSQNTIESVIKKMYYKIHNITMVSTNGHGYGYGHGHQHKHKHKHEQNTYKSQRQGTKYTLYLAYPIRMGMGIQYSIYNAKHTLTHIYGMLYGKHCYKYMYE